MIIDIYKRPEARGEYSYLALPTGTELPIEAINEDWCYTDREIIINNDKMIEGLTLKEINEQIADKGYAISSVFDKIEIGSGDSA